MFDVLFVCTGNTCRSSMAEILFKEMMKRDNLDDKIKVNSAGTGVYTSLPATDNAIQAIREFDLDLTGHRSQLLNIDMLKAADLILTMTRVHKAHILDIMPDIENKVFTFVEYAANGKEQDISDPFGYDLDTYRQCRDEISKYLEMVIRRIRDS